MEDKKKLDEYLEFAKGIAKDAGDIMLHYFNTNIKGTEYKKDETVVTLADKMINRMLIEKVKEKYPNHSVYGEEEKYGDLNNKYTWVTDPVDGTVMFAVNVPVACFSLALVKNGEPIVAVVNDPFTNSLYWAEIGEGAYKNGNKIHVNDYILEDKRATMNAECWKGCKVDIYDLKHNLKDKVFITNLGCVVKACMLVAEGSYVAEVFPAIGMNHYDVAASKLIVSEAGGIVTNLLGEKQRYDREIKGALLTNGVVHKNLLRELRKIDKKI